MADAPRADALGRTLQRQGNEKLKFAQKTKQKLYYREAIDIYSKALALKCSDQKLNAVIYSNRAQVNLTLGVSCILPRLQLPCMPASLFPPP